ncbi:MAG: hypothetical protein AB7F61_00230 [Desulfobulbus sp.]
MTASPRCWKGKPPKMDTTQLAITYTGPAAADPLELLVLEQESWSVYTGKVTKQELVRWLAAALAGDEYQSRIDCGMAGGQLVCVIYAYPLLPDLNYRMVTSWGALSGRVVEIIEADELVQFHLDTEATTAHPIRELRSVAWEDQCYDADGIIAGPALSSDGKRLFTASPVYGTAKVRYLFERHTYVLNAPRREGAIDNHFSSVVAGIYAGGLEVLVLEMPPGIEQFEADPDAVCGSGGAGGGSVTWPDDEYPVQPQAASRRTVVDYCAQKVTSDTYL